MDASVFFAGELNAYKNKAKNTDPAERGNESVATNLTTGNK